MAKIDAFFNLMHEQGASDLHLVAGQQPAIRIRGDIERIKYDVLTNDALKVLLYEITPEHKIPRTSRDKDDDHILAAALKAKVDCIITGDNDLLVLKAIEGIPILFPADFWKLEQAK